MLRNSWRLIFTALLSWRRAVGAEDCDKVGNYTVIRPGSKFLADGHCYPNNEDLQKPLCQLGGLEPAEIISLSDEVSLDSWIAPGKFYKLGFKQLEKKTLGNILNSAGEQIKFAYFSSAEPNNAGRGNPMTVEPCIVFHKEKLWIDAPCEPGPNTRITCTMCQFPPKSKCFKNSDEEKENKKQKDELKFVEKIGAPDAERRWSLYRNTLQKTFQQAQEICQKKKLSLIDVKDANFQEFYASFRPFLAEKQKQFGISPKLSYWVGASYNNKSKLCKPYNLNGEKPVAQTFELICEFPAYFYCVESHYYPKPKPGEVPTEPPPPAKEEVTIPPTPEPVEEESTTPIPPKEPEPIPPPPVIEEPVLPMPPKEPTPERVPDPVLDNSIQEAQINTEPSIPPPPSVNCDIPRARWVTTGNFI